MRIRLLAFAQAQDQLGFREREVEVDPAETPAHLLQRIAPQLSIGTMRVAVDQEYHEWHQPIGATAAEIALIPPVSGG